MARFTCILSAALVVCAGIAACWKVVKMHKGGGISALLALMIGGCSFPVQTDHKPAKATIRITVYRSQPSRHPQDTNILRDAGPAGVAAVGALVLPDPLYAVLGYFASQVALRAVERTSDAEFKRATIEVPVPESGAVYVTVPEEGGVAILRLAQPCAPTAEPADYLDVFKAGGIHPPRIGPKEAAP